MGIACFVPSCAGTGALVAGHVVQSRRVAKGVQYALLDYTTAVRDIYSLQ